MSDNPTPYELARGAQVQVVNPPPRQFVTWLEGRNLTDTEIFEGCVPLAGEQQAVDC